MDEDKRGGVVARTWKSFPKDHETVFEIPADSEKVIEIFIVQGARIVGEVTHVGKGIHAVMLKIADSKIDETVKIIHGLRSKGLI